MKGIKVNVPFIKDTIYNQGYASIKDFCEVNEFNYNTLSNVLHKNCISLPTLLKIAISLHCLIDDLLIYDRYTIHNNT